MKRPIGLILSAVVLSLAALFLLALTALMAVAGIVANRQPTIATAPHVTVLLILGLSFLYAALAIWAILTVIGILRLRPWARYSILVFGGGLAAVGLLLAVGTALSRALVAAIPANGRTTDPHLMAVIFTILIAFYAATATIGTWWLIYFNLRPTRELFHTSEFVFPLHSTSGDLPHRPTAITILACLFLFSAVCCCIMAFTPFPAFLLGFILPARSAHILYLVFALIAALVSFGLLKLQEYARFATIAFIFWASATFSSASSPGIRISSGSIWHSSKWPSPAI